MSNVLAFRPDRRKRRSQTDDSPFQLLFFTGVRYVRPDEAETIRKQRRRAPRSKDASKRSA